MLRMRRRGGGEAILKEEDEVKDREQAGRGFKGIFWPYCVVSSSSGIV